MLGAAARYTEAQVLAGFRVGLAIAKHGHNVITGATVGVPYAAAIGAKMGGAVVVGISPAACREEHIERYKRPLDNMDVIVYTGMGLEGRQPINVRSGKGAIFIAGEFGTLGEFSAAWTVGNNVLGVLEGVGGISSNLRQIIQQVQSEYGSAVLFDSDPESLARRVCEEVDRRYPLNSQSAQANQNGADVKSIIDAYLDGHTFHLEAETGKM